MLRKLIILVFVVFIASIAPQAYAATYYLANSPCSGNADWENGSNSNAGTSKGAPWLTLRYAFGAMAGGDTLVIDDGTYTGANNTIYGLGGAYAPPVGSAGAYTTLRADNDGMVTFDGEDARLMFDVDYDTTTSVYWQFEGLIWANAAAGGGNSCNVGDCRYVKFLRCGAYDVGAGNTANFRAATNSSYILYEGCYSYGSGRYKFTTYHANHVVIRNCVARFDWVNAGGEPTAVFSVYSSTDVEVQNCIAIDADQTGAWSNVGDRQGCFFVPCTDGESARVNFTNCVGLNVKLGGVQTAHNTDSSYVNFLNCVIWDCTDAGQLHSMIRGSYNTITNCTFGVGAGGITQWMYWDGSNGEMYNTIVMSMTTSSHLQYPGASTMDYNCYYNNSSSYQTTGSHNVTGVNPLSASLLYLPRIEPGSALSAAGSGGADIGATALTLIGTSGTLWGETGYATDTGLDMWPYPNEDLIRTKLRAYTNGSPAISGARGFCADGQTLTTYIWEYLGNEIPDEIYGADVTPPAAITDLAAVVGDADGEVDLSWTAPGDDGDVGSADRYVIRYSESEITAGNFSAASDVSGEPEPSPAGSAEALTVTGLTPGTTYHFAMVSLDEEQNQSDLSNDDSAAAYIDATAPAAVSDLSAAPGTAAGSIVVTWTAPGDDNVTGTATTYDLRYSTSTITTGNWATATEVSAEPTPSIAGTAETKTVTGLVPGGKYYFAIKTDDDIPNTSALSNIASADAPLVPPVIGGMTMTGVNVR